MRLPDANARLNSYLDEVRRRPFTYGTHDCALFAAGAVEAMTGIDPAARLRGQYDNPEVAFAALQSVGYEDHIAAAKALLQAYPRVFAQRGDIAIADLPEPSLGVVTGHKVDFVSEKGLIVLDLMSPLIHDEVLRAV